MSKSNSMLSRASGVIASPLSPAVAISEAVPGPGGARVPSWFVPPLDACRGLDSF